MITYHLLSNQGDRGNNEDNVGMYQREQEYCFVLADGLGGHGKGELASQLGVESSIKDALIECLDDFLKNGFSRELLESRAKGAV